MNNDHLNQTLKHLRENIAMTSAEKERVFTVLKEHTALNNPSIEPRLFAARSPYSALGTWFGRFAAVAVIMVVITGSGVVAVADQALPGDALFGFKVNVNEEIQSFLRPNSPAAQLVYEAERTQQRIQEAQTLISQGRFDQDAQADVTRSLEKHSKTIDKQAKKAAAEDPAEYQLVSADIQKKIASSVDVLVEAASKNDGEIQNVSLEGVLAVADSTVEKIETIDNVVALETPKTDIATSEDGTDKETSKPNLADYTYKHPEYLAFVTKDVASQFTIFQQEIATPVVAADPAPAAVLSETPEPIVAAAETTNEISSIATDPAPAIATASESTEKEDTVESQPVEEGIAETDTKEPTKGGDATEKETPTVEDPVAEEKPATLSSDDIQNDTLDALQETLAELEQAHAALGDAYGAKPPLDEDLIHALSTKVLVYAQTAYDLLGVPLPDLQQAFPDIDFGTAAQTDTATARRTNGIVPIEPVAEDTKDEAAQAAENIESDEKPESQETDTQKDAEAVVSKTVE